jgi:regulator of sigma E protease
LSNILISVLSFLLAISVLVAVHEFGHFWVARKVGIRVLRFSIGFGKPLWSRKVGPDQMELVVASIPMGGYVKMLDEREADVPEADRKRSFNAAPMWARMAVLFGGPAANFLFAIAAYWVMFVAGVPGLAPVIGDVDPDSIAAEAGLRGGDRIREIENRAVDTWETALLVLLDDMIDDGRISLKVQGEDGSTRNVLLDAAGRESSLTEPGALFTGLGMHPWRPQWPAIIEAVDADGPAQRAGMQAGDRVLSLNDSAVADWPGLVSRLQELPNQRVRLTVERGGRSLELDIMTQSMERDGRTVGRIGVEGAKPESIPESMTAKSQYGPIAAIPVALTKTWEMTALTLRMLWKMLEGVVSPKNISGPINIAQYAGVSASLGLVAFASFLAVVSISLGIINLMPVPMLDGGQLLYHFAELVTGKPLPDRIQMIGHQVGLLLLALLMTFAFYNDIARLLD